MKGFLWGPLRMVKSGDLGGRENGRRSEDFITGREHKKIEIKNKVPLGGGWVEGVVKTLLLGGSTKKISAAGRGVSGRRSEDFITGRKHKKISAAGRWVSGRRSEDFITGRKHKKNKCRWEGGEWKEEWRLYYWEGAQKKISAAGRGVSGRRSEDFITGRKHKKK